MYTTIEEVIDTYKKELARYIKPSDVPQARDRTREGMIQGMQIALGLNRTEIAEFYEEAYEKQKAKEARKSKRKKT